MARGYGVLMEDKGICERAIVVVDKQGKVAYVDVHELLERAGTRKCLFEVLRKLRAAPSPPCPPLPRPLCITHKWERESLRSRGLATVYETSSRRVESFAMTTSRNACRPATLGAADWAQAELGQAALGDARRTRRLVQLTAAWAAHPTASFPALAGTAAATKATYRFFDAPAQVCDRDVPEAIRAAHYQATKARLAGGGRVLAVQDTTSLDFTAHPATDGLGPLETARRVGLFVHSTLAVGTDGQPYGLLAQAVWAREPAARGSRHQRRQRPTAAKESQKWLTALRASQADLPADVTLVHVGDQEADLYDLFRAARACPQTELLVRATGTRRPRAAGAVARGAVRAAGRRHPPAAAAAGRRPPARTGASPCATRRSPCSRPGIAPPSTCRSCRSGRCWSKKWTRKARRRSSGCW